MSVLTIRNGGAWNRAKPARLFFWLAVVIVCVSADPAHGAKLSDDGRPVFHPADHARLLGRTGARHSAARAPRARATGEDTACSVGFRAGLHFAGIPVRRSLPVGWIDRDCSGGASTPSASAVGPSVSRFRR